MSFTLPVGQFQPAGAALLIRPTSVVDTVGAGTITNSSNAYDAFPYTYGVWTDAANTPSQTTYSIYSFSSGTVTASQLIYIVYSYDSYSPGTSGALYLSTDSGSTYPLSVGRNLNDGLTHTDSIIIPDGITISNIKLKVYPYCAPLPHISNMRVYDLYIQ